MYVKLTPLFHRGVSIPPKVRDTTPSVTGVLHLHEERVARIGRTVRIARIKDPADATIQSKIAPLYDAVIEYLVDNQMRIRGIEEEEGVVYAQCWDIRLVKIT